MQVSGLGLGLGAFINLEEAFGMYQSPELWI